MSEAENFLSRWARLKREAAETPDDAAPDTPATGADEPTAEAIAPPAPKLEFDLATLPPIESITAATDIRAFLAPGVPPELTRAALRRAWVADPTIRDFVGIAENQWDFNDPEGIPGFGALGPLDVRRLVATVLGGSEEAAAAPSPAKSDELSTPDAPAAALGATPGDMSARDAPRETPPVSEVTHGEPDGVTVATQNEDDPSSSSAAPPRRGHGGALPR